MPLASVADQDTFVCTLVPTCFLLTIDWTGGLTVGRPVSLVNVANAFCTLGRGPILPLSTPVEVVSCDVPVETSTLLTCFDVGCVPLNASRALEYATAAPATIG